MKLCKTKCIFSSIFSKCFILLQTEHLILHPTFLYLLLNHECFHDITYFGNIDFYGLNIKFCEYVIINMCLITGYLNDFKFFKAEIFP